MYEGTGLSLVQSCRIRNITYIGVHFGSESPVPLLAAYAILKAQQDVAPPAVFLWNCGVRGADAVCLRGRPNVFRPWDIFCLRKSLRLRM